MLSPELLKAPAPSSSDWDRVADQMGPNLGHWLLASVLAAGGMLVASPIRNGWPVLSAVGATALAAVLFLLGWMAGMRTFAYSCQMFRRLHPTFRLRYLAPLIVLGVAGLGFLGWRYWWVFAPVVAFLGHRKGTQRAWWIAVANLAFVFRGEQFGVRIAATDEEAIAKAKDAINESIGRSPRGGDEREE